MNSHNISLGLLVGLYLGALFILIVFGPRTIQFLRTDKLLHLWLVKRWKWLRQHGPTWQELLTMVLIFLVGIVAKYLINFSY